MIDFGDILALSISFIIPALNEATRLPGALDSIIMQDYPGKVEIILADGGSTDGTVEIAKKYGCRIIADPTKLPEARMHLAFQQSKGDVCVFMSADNCLVGKDWLKKMLKPLELEEVKASTTLSISDKTEYFLNQYLNNLIQSDPLTHFVYGPYADLREMKQVYPVYKETSDYTIFDFDSKNFPTIALNQGFLLKRDVGRDESSEDDDIVPIMQMIEKNMKIAYVPNAGIHHYSFTSIRGFFNKYKRRALVNLTGSNASFKTRVGHLSAYRRFLMLVSPIYLASFVWPAYYSLKGFIKSKDTLWFIHPFICWLFFAAMAAAVIEYALKGGKIPQLLRTR